jgi:undecaprenyl diphosphate synthase
MSIADLTRRLLAPAVAEPVVVPVPAARPALKTRVRVPRHVGIIMDGNGRWGSERRLPRLEGHARGVEAARRAIRGSLENGIEVLSLYAFSTLNWKRPPEEVHGLMALLSTYLEREAMALAEQGVRFRLLGGRERLPEEVRAAADRAERVTAGGERMTLTLGVNYGGQEELTEAIRSLAIDVAAGRLTSEAVNARLIEARLFTVGLPPVDLVIRTAGEQRLSNFMLWQSAYAELFFMDVLWPDFNEAHLAEALNDYARRRRTFGGLPDARGGNA